MFVIRRTNIRVIYSMENKMNVKSSVVFYFLNKVFFFLPSFLNNAKKKFV